MKKAAEGDTCRSCSQACQNLFVAMSLSVIDPFLAAPVSRAAILYFTEMNGCCSALVFNPRILAFGIGSEERAQRQSYRHWRERWKPCIRARTGKPA